MFKEMFLHEKTNFIDINGIDVVPDSFRGGNFVDFDEFEIEEEGNYATRKGQVKKYEREDFEEEHGLELPAKKSDFPFVMNWDKSKRTYTSKTKCKLIEDIHTLYIVQIKGNRNLTVIETNENQMYDISKKSLNNFTSLSEKEIDEIYSKLYNS